MGPKGVVASMNKNSAIIAGALGVLLVVGLVIYSKDNTTDPSTNSTSTSTNSSSTGTNNNGSPSNNQPSAPTVVTNKTATPTDTTAVVTGSVTSNGSPSSYWYEYGTTSNLGSKTSNQNLGSSYTSIPAPGFITGMTKNTTYFFRLVAENQYGRTAGAQSSFKTANGVPDPTGRAPESKTIAANAVARTNATINGEVTPNQAATQYWFEYGRTKNLGNATPLVSAGNGNSKVSVSAQIANLDPATIYYFRVNAQNQFGTVNGETLNFQTEGPAVSTAPSASTGNTSNVTASGATLRGTVDPNLAETTYWFEYSVDGLLGSLVSQSTERKSAGSGSNDVSVSADVTSLASKTTYYYRMVAQNAHGIDRGDRGSFTTK